VDIKKIVPSINKHIKKDVAYIAPGKNAHLGLSVPEIVIKYGSVYSKIKSIPTLGAYMVGCISQLRKTYSELYKQPKNPTRRISDKDFEDLQALVKDLEIDDIGFTQVDIAYIFSDKMIFYKNAIVLLMEMNPEMIKTAPSKYAEKEIFRTYYRLNMAANKIKHFLNQRGYNAEAGPALGGEVNYPLLAQQAEMGMIGKHGLLITPRFGPSLRLAAVYTDIENLPMTSHTGHLWISEFCNHCNICLKKCPAQAIYPDTKIFDDGTQQCIDYKKCAVPFSKNHGCTVCIKECAFFKSDYEKIKERNLKADSNLK